MTAYSVHGFLLGGPHLKRPSYEKASELPSDGDKGSYGEIISIEDVNGRHF
jgi:hypothetical protein